MVLVLVFNSLLKVCAGGRVMPRWDSGMGFAVTLESQTLFGLPCQKGRWTCSRGGMAGEQPELKPAKPESGDPKGSRELMCFAAQS